MNTHKVAICAYKGLSMLEFGAAVEIFSSYGKHFQPWYQTQIVSVDESYLPIAENTGLSADTDLGVLSQVNTVVIPGWTSLQREADRELINALQQAHARCRLEQRMRRFPPGLPFQDRQAGAGNAAEKASRFSPVRPRATGSPRRQGSRKEPDPDKQSEIGIPSTV